MLACGRSCCYGLSHFLQLTYMLANCRVRSVFSFILFSTLLRSHRNANPTQELAFNRSFRSISLISLLGAFVFSTHKSCACSLASLRSAKLQHPAQKPLTVHSLHSSTFSLSVQPLLFPPTTFEQKNAPNRLPAAPSQRTPCFLCLGHSLHSQRLAHNAQA